MVFFAGKYLLNYFSCSFVSFFASVNFKLTSFLTSLFLCPCLKMAVELLFFFLFLCLCDFQALLSLLVMCLPTFLYAYVTCRLSLSPPLLLPSLSCCLPCPTFPCNFLTLFSPRVSFSLFSSAFCLSLSC